MLMYIHAHYNEPLTLAQIAANLYMNPAYLGRLFKKYTGMTCAKYLMSYRINVAQKMLANRESSISEIAHAVGYTNINHFYKLFRQQTGRTPTQFRSNLQQYAPSANLFILPNSVEKNEPHSLELPADAPCCGGAFLSMNNSLIYAYVQGGKGAAQVRLLSSLDGGLSWSAPRTLLEAECRDPSPGLAGFLLMQDGAVAVMLAENRGDAYWLVQYHSYDGLKTFRKTRRDTCLSSDFFAECGCAVRLERGRLALPVSSCRASQTPARGVTFFVSDDDGVTWTMVNHALSLSCRSTVQGLRYPALLPEKGSTVRCFAATDLGCQYESVSLDDAQSWSQPQPTLISSPMACMSVAQFDSGLRAALFNPVPDYVSRGAGKTETRLVLMTNAGNGMGWAYPLVVEKLRPSERAAFSCLSLYCAGSTLFAAYVIRRENRQTLRLRLFQQAGLIMT
ncbi:MAG: AraC family transcriptional regulator [Clostridia bacterium]|nr:AraC family transcriptional regulator [Clostridia bacterium]MBR4442078.1 AraC family transcriptional regulator [Clostridia bacterium]